MSILKFIEIPKSKTTFVETIEILSFGDRFLFRSSANHFIYTHKKNVYIYVTQQKKYLHPRWFMPGILKYKKTIYVKRRFAFSNLKFILLKLIASRLLKLVNYCRVLKKTQSNLCTIWDYFLTKSFESSTLLPETIVFCKN